MQAGESDPTLDAYETSKLTRVLACINMVGAPLIQNGLRRPKRRVRALHYAPEMERVTGIGPASAVWKTAVLPLYDTREIWSGERESNPCRELGKLTFYH